MPQTFYTTAVFTGETDSPLTLYIQSPAGTVLHERPVVLKVPMDWAADRIAEKISEIIAERWWVGACHGWRNIFDHPVIMTEVYEHDFDPA